VLLTLENVLAILKTRYGEEETDRVIAEAEALGVALGHTPQAEVREIFPGALTAQRFRNSAG
jgi:hypothetical protein